jgi:hypothetical protein
MPLFLVVPLVESGAAFDSAVEARIEQRHRYRLQAQRGWLIYFEGTTVELSETIGLTGENKPPLGSALITAIGSYYGRGPTDMWEWLKTRMER